MPNHHLYDEEVGLLKRGTIIGFDPNNGGVLKIRLDAVPSIRSQQRSIDVPVGHALYYNNGLFVGTAPVNGTPVVVGQGSGGGYYFVSFLSATKSPVPNLNLGELLIRANDFTKITLNKDTNDIYIGATNSNIHINTKYSYNILTTNFYNENHFTQGTRRVEGLVKRDLVINTNYDQNSKLEDDSYDPIYKIIGLDPTVSPNQSISGSNKNPPFVEQREIVYEFQYASNINDDLSESFLYGNTNPPTTSFTFPNRRKSRADTLSLTLLSPNYLMETIKGTVVDIFGNILDINRSPLPIGTDQNTINDTTSTDKIKSYQLIKELERKSLAYHFEINARKDLTGQNGQIVFPDINSNTDYARNRSRFFFDIDKEGVFKLNVPASSEKGNVPLLTRYENYSSFGPEDNNNPNKLIFRDDNLDIFPDAFVAPNINIDDFTSTPGGSVILSSGGANTAPIDRITGNHIKHGTAYHDVLATCYVHQKSDFLNYILDESNPLVAAIDKIPLLQVASDIIDTGGNEGRNGGADGGGRSGSINFDGSIDLNIGANTVDRQSLWLDTAGGIVANVGRDVGNMSAAVSMNGDLFLQVGGAGVNSDSRFAKKKNGHYGAAVDIRVIDSGGRATMVRIDDEGVKIMTPGNMFLHASQNMRISSDADIVMECENLTLQGRLVSKGGIAGSI